MLSSLSLAFLQLKEQPEMLFAVGLSLLALFLWYFATEIDRRKRNIGSVLVLGILLLCIDGLFPLKEKLRGGIDIKGGASFVLEVQQGTDPDGNPLPVTRDLVDQARDIIRERLDPNGTIGVTPTRQGDNRIIVQMPDVNEEQAREIATTLKKTAKLEIRRAHSNSAGLIAQLKSGEIRRVPGFRVFKERKVNDETGEVIESEVLLSNKIGLDGSSIKVAWYDPALKGQVQVKLDSEGGDKMEAMTKPMVPGRDLMAIVLDGVAINVSSLASDVQFLSENFRMTGIGSETECRELAKALMNPLKNPLKILDQRQVSATLGAATVKQGITSGLTALALTVVFILLYYRVAGIFALIGLLINVTILFGTMAMFGFTFTLAGIAGVILTIGVAVDANVLIYERLREELNAGKSVKGALKAAFEKAFSAIFDANITTLIIAIILYFMASGTVKGFAVTLIIGIIASMFAALLAVRVMFWWGTDKGLVKKLSFMDLVPKNRIDFLSKRKLAFLISGILFAGSLTTFFTKGEESLGIEFTGGTLISYQLDDKELPSTKVQAVLDKLTLTKQAVAQDEITSTGELLSIRCDKEDIKTIKDALTSSFPELASIESSTTGISAVFGAESLRDSAVALVVGLFALLVYLTFRFEFSFALGATVAIFHDLAISLGVVILLGSELSLIQVAAILTIAGYSINDTIVVFDRIRENLRTRRGDTKSIMNEAISATLSRTVLTSLTTFVAVLVLFLYGGAGLKDFSQTIMIGVIVGTYSSIFIAAPVVYLWSKFKGTNLRREVLDADIQAEIEVGAAE